LSIEKSLKDGLILSLSDTVNSYYDLLCNHGVETCMAWTTKKKKMKEEIQKRISNVEFVDSYHKNESQKFFWGGFLSSMVEEVMQKSPEQLSEDLDILVRAAKILRSLILDFRKKYEFNFRGSVVHDETSVPDDLREFIKWVLSGGELQGQHRDSEINRRSLTLSNLFLYNAVSDRQRRYQSTNEKSLRHMYVPL